MPQARLNNLCPVPHGIAGQSLPQPLTDCPCSEGYAEDKGEEEGHHKVPGQTQATCSPLPGPPWGL